MSRVAPYAGGAWSRGPRRAAGGSAAADPVRARRRVNHVMTLNCHATFAEALYSDARASRGDVLQAVTILEDVVRARRRVLGKHHPETAFALTHLERARMRHEDVAAP